MGDLDVKSEPWGSPVAEQLTNELGLDLDVRYADEDASGEAEIDLELAEVKAESVTPPHGQLVVAWLDGEPVGCGALRPAAPPATAEIKRMYVRPAARGSGVSRAILAALEDAARALGYRRIILETGTRQPEAMGLYESAGYTPIEAYGAYRASPLSRCFERTL